MKTSELPVGSVIKFKNSARIHSFYDRHDLNKSGYMMHHVGSMMMIDINQNDVVTILKTSEKDNHVGQTVFLRGTTKVLYYRKDTFFDNNQASLGNVDLTVRDYYYDVISS